MINISPKTIPGKWREGYALDYHTLKSDFIGYDEYGHPLFNTERTEIGELLYKLKYKLDKSVITSIVETTADFVNSWGQKLNLILPTPPSRSRRSYQPVIEIAKALSLKLKVAFCNNCINKVKATPELKNVYDYNERIKLLQDAYNINRSKVKGQNVLLFDDLYRSGATLNAITDALYLEGEVANVYALALTRTRSAS
jgi:competence protein ComFC